MIPKSGNRFSERSCSNKICAKTYRWVSAINGFPPAFAGVNPSYASGKVSGAISSAERLR
jgi:hypothetical protein